MVVPARFVTEYPLRCMELFELIEPMARDKDLLGSFSLIVATSVFLIPYERMNDRHFLNRRGKEPDLYDAIDRIERQHFLKAEFWRNGTPQEWRFSRIMNEVERTARWRDDKNRHPLAADAVNKIARKKVKDVLYVIRNALAHGNVVYLDEHGSETPGAKLRYLAFLSRCEEEVQPDGNTYHVVTTTGQGFLDFVKVWATWLAELPGDTRLSVAAE